MLGWLGSGTSSDMVDSSSSALCIPGEEEEEAAAAAIFNISLFLVLIKETLSFLQFQWAPLSTTPTHAKRRHSFSLETNRCIRDEITSLAPPYHPARQPQTPKSRYFLHHHQNDQNCWVFFIGAKTIANREEEEYERVCEGGKARKASSVLSFSLPSLPPSSNPATRSPHPTSRRRH